MSATDSKSYVIEIGEHNLLIARVELGDKNRRVEALREVWLGDNAAVESALSEVKVGAASGKAIVLLRPKVRDAYLADQTQSQKIGNAAAVEGFLKEKFSAENLPANWSWCTAKDGRAPSNGATWLLNAVSAANVTDFLDKIKQWAIEPLRCESAGLALVGGLISSLKSAPQGTAILLCDIAELRTTLVLLTAQGVSGLGSASVGFDALAESTQGALGLKFRGSAARLLFNESYDFSEASAKIVEPLANGIKSIMPSLGALAPTHLVCSGILAKQAWLSQQLAAGLGLKAYTPDISAWATSAGLKIDASATAEMTSPTVLAALSALTAYDSRNPGAAAPWHTVLSGTPFAQAPIIPAILFEDPPPAPVVAPVVKVEAPKPAPVKVEPPKAAPAPAKPEPSKPVAPAAKPAVVITPPPPAKPAAPEAAKKAPVAPEPAKPAAPVAKPAAPVAAKQPAASTAPKTPAKPAGTPPVTAPAVAKSPAKPATAAPFPAKKNNMPMIIGVIVLLAIGGGGFFWYSGQQEQKQKDAELRLKAENEEKLAQQKREFEAKQAALKAEQERKIEEERIAREKAEKESIEAAKQASIATQEQLLNARGALVVATEPAGASIIIGELAPLPSPLNKKDLRLGTYNVVISLAGYDSETRTIEIKPNATVDLGTIKLNRQVGTIDLTSNPEGQTYEIRPDGALFVNPKDVRSGKTPATLKDIPLGKYKVTISRAGWPDHVDSITVTKGGVFKSHAEFPNGSVTIESSPAGATVTRDGQALGVTPLTLNNVAIGDVKYTLSLPLMDDVVVSGVLEGGKSLSLSGTLQPTDRIMKTSELEERPTPMGELASPDLTNIEILNSLTVNISMIVNRDGVPEDIKVENASGVPGLGRACLVAASKWRFKPGAIKGQAVRTRVTIPFRVAAPAQ